MPSPRGGALLAGYVRRPHKGCAKPLDGSSLCGVAVSPGGKIMVVGRSSELLHVIDLDQPDSDSYQHSSGSHVERRRWIFWKGEHRAPALDGSLIAYQPDVIFTPDPLVAIHEETNKGWVARAAPTQRLARARRRLRLSPGRRERRRTFA